MFIDHNIYYIGKKSKVYRKQFTRNDRPNFILVWKNKLQVFNKMYSKNVQNNFIFESYTYSLCTKCTSIKYDTR